jgi:hypothetical protein
MERSHTKDEHAVGPCVGSKFINSKLTSFVRGKGIPHARPVRVLPVIFPRSKVLAFVEEALLHTHALSRPDDAVLAVSERTN